MASAAAGLCSSACLTCASPPSSFFQPPVAELLTLGAQLDTPLLHVGFRAPALVPACLAAGSTALHVRRCYASAEGLAA